MFTYYIISVFGTCFALVFFIIIKQCNLFFLITIVFASNFFIKQINMDLNKENTGKTKNKLSLRNKKKMCRSEGKPYMNKKNILIEGKMNLKKKSVVNVSFSVTIFHIHKKNFV